MIKNWISDDNLKAFVEILSSWIGYNFGQMDWDAIRFGVENTNQEADKWFDYTLEGRQTVKLWFAIDPGTYVVHVRIDCPPELSPKLEAAIDIMGIYKLVK
ncbi:MAG: hypothetical protein HZA50_14885 [Planctomycetes bacterium]|nr:hypothetical protein [Planctomycetota bacterium]